VQVSAAPAAPAPAQAPAPLPEKKPMSDAARLGLIGGAAGDLPLLSSISPEPFLGHFMVFALAVVIGFYVIGNVHHALHTPLMSVTNAISGIILVGALLQIGHGDLWVTVLAFMAILVASINVFGGFTVTARMLEMFKREDRNCPMTLTLVQGAYIVAALLFILALAGLSKHETARMGNLTASSA
jgi:NAD(P) transhydrogenase subunit alpha